MTDADLTRLEALAAAATNGPWHVWVKDPDIVCHGHGSEQDPDGRDTYTIADTSGCLDDNAAYIAALSPDVVLALVAEVRRLRAPQYLAARLRHQREQASRFDGLDDACACSDCVLVRGGQ